jgi:hypothetical protein
LQIEECRLSEISICNLQSSILKLSSYSKLYFRSNSRRGRDLHDFGKYKRVEPESHRLRGALRQHHKPGNASGKNDNFRRQRRQQEPWEPGGAAFRDPTRYERCQRVR